MCMARPSIVPVAKTSTSRYSFGFDWVGRLTRDWTIRSVDWCSFCTKSSTNRPFTCRSLASGVISSHSSFEWSYTVELQMPDRFIQQGLPLRNLLGWTRLTILQCVLERQYLETPNLDLHRAAPKPHFSRLEQLVVPCFRHQTAVNVETNGVSLDF